MILVIDTSGNELGLGLGDDSGVLVAEFHATATAAERGVHDARLASECERMIREAGIAPRDISRIGLIIGPGSFTGLRIGLSFVKGFCYGSRVEIVTVTQHEHLKAESMQQGITGELLVTPGYQERLCYVAEWESPCEIEMKAVAEVIGSEKAIVAMGERFEGLSNVTVVQPTISTLARIAAAGMPVEDWVSLEPLYITEFQTNGRVVVR